MIAAAPAALVARYVDALRAARYADAFSLLTAAERRYFGDAAAYRSVFAADGVTIIDARVTSMRGSGDARVVFVRERIAYDDRRAAARRTIVATVPIGVVNDRGALRIDDPDKPYRAAIASDAAQAGGVRVAVEKLEYWPDRIAVTVQIANLGERLVTVLPYGRSSLRGSGAPLRPLAGADLRGVDRRLYEGVPLPARAQIVGTISFAARRPVANAPLRLVLGPVVPSDGGAPFRVTVAVAPRTP